MAVSYDKYYQTENLFGKPSCELIDFFSSQKRRGRVLDLGCGQGRNAIPLARMGFDVTGIDNSKVGIEQMKTTAPKENLPLKGIVGDIFKFDELERFDFIILDSMFHFAKNDYQRETGFIKYLVNEVRQNTMLIFCLPNTRNKVEVLNRMVNFEKELKRVAEQEYTYLFEDRESGHASTTNYKMIVFER